eukprot:TRINITY_DN10784_c0_g1_i1.p1 TRINITY_DN10784_c0_g1~~TRINITY_DN10784_c0_g1_i1.p1  ORF type:complete len:405 (+),score=123.40 TRINITY_DN10784_c0_g1_i1:97-1311(+)
MADPAPVLDWFDHLAGFSEFADGELDLSTVHSSLELCSGVLRSAAHDRAYEAGQFEVARCGELRERVLRMLARPGSAVRRGAVTLLHKAGDAMAEHADPANSGACFQVASQANCLESASRWHGPASGLTPIIGDFTQGPACALACGAGTISRRYLIDMPSGAQGQSVEDQLNLFGPLEHELGNDAEKFFTVHNGYATAAGETPEQQAESLRRMRAAVQAGGADLAQRLRDSVCVGIQRRSEVVFAGRAEFGLIPYTGEKQLVTQVLCSAVSFQDIPADHRELWGCVAREVLAGGYEATLWAAAAEGIDRVQLTLVGGGAFANKREWIVDAISRACAALSEAGVQMQVTLLHYRAVDPAVRDAVRPCGAPRATPCGEPWTCAGQLGDGLCGEHKEGCAEQCSSKL